MQWDGNCSDSEDSGVLVWKVCILVIVIIRDCLTQLVHGVHYPKKATSPEGIGYNNKKLPILLCHSK